MDFQDLNYELSQLNRSQFETYREVALNYFESTGLIAELNAIRGDSSAEFRYRAKLKGSLEVADTGEELSYGIIETYQNQANLEVMPCDDLDRHDSVEFEQVVERTLGAAYEKWEN